MYARRGSAGDGVFRLRLWLLSLRSVVPSIEASIVRGLVNSDPIGLIDATAVTAGRIREDNPARGLAACRAGSKCDPILALSAAASSPERISLASVLIDPKGRTGPSNQSSLCTGRSRGPEAAGFPRAVGRPEAPRSAPCGHDQPMGHRPALRRAPPHVERSPRTSWEQRPTRIHRIVPNAPRTGHRERRQVGGLALADQASRC